MKHKTKKPNVLERIGAFNIAFDGKVYLVLKPKRPVQGIGRGFKTKDAACLFAQGSTQAVEAKQLMEKYSKMKGTWTERKVHKFVKTEQEKLDHAETVMLRALEEVVN
jgi:hypothetical protein